MAKGCYLTFSDASQGTLFLHWSEAPVAGALAFFEPRKNVPAFKYKSNGGRSELIREMSGGTGERIKRFYQRANRIYGHVRSPSTRRLLDGAHAGFYTGICQYVKLAKSFDAAVVFYEHGTLPAVEIALIDGAKSDYNVIHIKTNAPVESLASVTAVGVAPGASDAFAASTFSREYFISTASKAGSALAI